MKLANFELEGRTRAGVVRDGRVFEIPSAASVMEVVQQGRPIPMGSGAGTDLEGVRLLAPVLNPGKVLLAAVNYRAHGTEQNAAPPGEPYFFTKFGGCTIGNGDEIVIPRMSARADWEVELAVVMGKKCKHVSRRDALDFVAGYAVANDVSYRDLQFPKGWPEKLNTLGQNWVMGKALDSSFPLGPWLVTPDEIDDPQKLSLSLTVNGVQRQSASTEDMVFSVAELIEYLSNGITLLPGDVISTGTPAGVAAFSGAPYLKDGDVVRATVEKIGTLVNPVKSE